MNIETIESIFNDHEKVLQKSRTLFPVILDMADICRRALAEGHKILICGNGGSAADAQHIAAEFVGRFHNERVSLPSIALTTDTSILTAVANDYSYDRVFARQVEGLGNKGDVLWGISTSGSTGKTGGDMVSLCDRVLVVPDDVTARIQEIHMLSAHIICQLIDDLEWKQ